MRAEAPAEPSGPVMGNVQTGDPTALLSRPKVRPYKPFTFPDDFAAEIMDGPDWRTSQFTATHLTFGLTTVTLDHELAGSDDKVKNSALFLIQRAIVMIGGQTGLDYTFVQDWMNAIGPKGRGVVGQLYVELNAADVNVGKSMMATAGDWTS